MYAFILSVINLFKIILFFLIAGAAYPFLRSKSVYLYLRFCGPTFIKLGQLLSTRDDLVGEELAVILSGFQDRLSPFSPKKSKAIIERELGASVNQIFSEFNEIPVASASIAQVHKAKLLNGDVVAVKVLRPSIQKIMARDITTLRLFCFVVGIFSSYTKEKIIDILDLLQNCYERELDLTQEASAASSLREKLSEVEGFYIPKIYWNLTTSKILTLEWIDGIPFSNKEAIKQSKFDKKKIARNLVISYFNQVYAHGFFHADMHPGNLFLMKNGDIAAIDFGIIGIIDKPTRIAIAEIVIAFLKRDYTKVAKLHVKAGLVPEDVNIEEFALTSRIIGETMVDMSIKQVSLAKLLGLLIRMTKKYNMKTKPELLLLQKTIMLVEGVGMQLDPNLNMWELARPWMEEWASKNIGFDAKIVDQLLLFLDAIKKLSAANENSSGDALLIKKMEKLKQKTQRLKIALAIAIGAILVLIVF